MTTELTKAAQQALEALKWCYDVVDYPANGTSRQDKAIADLERALTQRPAAQTDRWMVAAVDAAMVEMKNISPSLRRSECERLIRAAAECMPAPQQATPEPSRSMIGMGAHALANELAQAVAQDDADPDGHDMSAGLFGPNVSAWLRKISAEYLLQPATPEPVGEPGQFPPMPEGWPALFRCDSCDGKGEIGELVSMGDFQPPERQTCPDCGGRGWTSEEPAFNAEHMREFAEAHERNTRPAPGVPEGFVLVPVEPTQEMVDAGNKARVYREHGSLDQPDVLSARTYNTKQAWSEMLAAAQANGGCDGA